MANEKRFVYKISAEAEYKGDKELADLRGDLKKIGEIKSFEKVAAGWKKTRTELAKAKERAKELQVQLKKGGGKEVEKNFKAASRQVARLTASLDKQKTALKGSTATLKSNGIAVGKVTAEYAKLEQSATAQAKKIAGANKLGIRTSADILADIKAREKAYSDLKSGGVTDIKTLIRAEKALQKQTASLKNELDGVEESGGGIKTLAGGIAGGIASIGVAGKALQATKFFTEFENELLATQALAGASEQQFVQLKQAAYDMADASAGPKALAAGYAELATSGATVNEILGASGTVKLLTAASRGAFTFKTAGDTLTNTLKVFGLGLKDNIKVGDILVKGWTSAGQEADELGEALVRAGGRFSKTYENLSKVERLQKATAVIAALAEVGYKGSEGATVLNNTLRQLIKPGKAAREVLEKYKNVIKIFDDTGNVRDFALIIDDIKDAGLGARDSMALFGDEAGKAMPALVAQGGDFIRGFEADINGADGAMQNIADVMSKGLGGGFKTLSAQFGVFTAKMVDSVAPALHVVVNGITSVVVAIAKLPAPVLATGVAMVGLATAGAAVVSALAVWGTIGPAVVAAVVTLKTGVLFLSAGMVTLRAGIAATIVSMGALGVASAALGGAWGAVKIIEAVGAYREMRAAQKMAAEAGEREAKVVAKKEARYARISEVLGRQVTRHQEVQAAVQAGELAWDKETDTYSKGAGVKVAAIESVSSARSKALKMEEGELDEIIALFDKYTDKIKEVDQAIKDVAQGGASDLFDLGLIGKSEQETWDAWRDSASGLGDQIRQTVTEAKRLSAEGDIDAANAKFAEAVELGKRMQSQYKSLATTIKNEFGVEAQAALEAAKGNVKALAKEGAEAIRDYQKALNKLKGTSAALADAQRSLEESQRDNAQSAMSASAAYKDQAQYADKLAAASEKAARAGDWDLAVEKARQAKDAYAELGSAANNVEQAKRQQIEETTRKEIEALGKRGLSAEAAAAKKKQIEKAAQAEIAALGGGKEGEKAAGAGIEKALQLEVAALKKKEAAEKKAVEAAKRHSAEITAAKEAEVKKVSELEARKEGIAQTAEESAKTAQAGVKEAVELVNGALESQGQILEEITKNLDENTGGAITRLKDQAGEFTEKWTAAAKTMGDETVREAKRASESLDDAARARTAVITTKTVTGQQMGGPVGVVTAMRNGGFYRPPRDARHGMHFGGYGGGDTWQNHVIAEKGEFMLRKEPVRAGGLDAAFAYNNGDFVGVVKKLARLPDVRDNLLGALSLPAISRLDPATANPAQGAGQLTGIELHNMETGQRASIFSTPSGLDMVTKGLARSYRLKSSGV